MLCMTEWILLTRSRVIQRVFRHAEHDLRDCVDIPSVAQKRLDSWTQLYLVLALSVFKWPGTT
jgi:hypothetical protein